jgi:protein translocase SecG subunit
MILCSIVLIVAVLMQSAKSGGVMTALTGESENFFGQSKVQGKEKRLRTITKALAIVIGVIALVSAIVF